MQQTLIQVEKEPSKKTLRALDLLALLMGDIGGGIGPYLAVYLRSVRHWDQANVGSALSAMGFATIMAQMPAGNLIDNFRCKRLLVAIAAGVIAFSCIAVTLSPSWGHVLTAQLLYGLAGTALGPTVVAISLGIVGHRKFAARIGRNEAFNHFGNVVVALLAGAVGYMIGIQWSFYVVAAVGMASMVAVFSIKKEDIDNQRARGLTVVQVAGNPDKASVLTVLTDRKMLVFALSVLFFNLANVALLPLAAQYIAEGGAKGAPLYMSGCIIAAQLMMIPSSILAGKFAQSWGRKPVFLIAFMVLPVRALLYTLSNNPWLVVAVQLLDGVGAGIYCVLTSVMVEDLTAGTGRYNVSRGFITTAQGIGAVVSNVLAGYIVAGYGYNAGFITLSGIALVALCLFWLAVPETKNIRSVC